MKKMAEEFVQRNLMFRYKNLSNSIGYIIQENLNSGIMIDRTAFKLANEELDEIYEQLSEENKVLVRLQYG